MKLRSNKTAWWIILLAVVSSLAPIISNAADVTESIQKSEPKRALMNVWHVPVNSEPPSTTMRNPVHPTYHQTPVYLYCGAYPQGTIWSGLITVHERYTPYNQTYSFTWDSNNFSNEYFRAEIANLFDPGDTIEYVFEMHGDPGIYETTYVHGDDSHSYTTDHNYVAWASPFIFTIPGPTPTPAPSPVMMNVWHIPVNEEPPTITMRSPLNPAAGQTPVLLFCGAYPLYTIWSGQVIYHKYGTPYWNTAAFNWDSNQPSNEYWKAELENYYSAGDRIDYILELHGNTGQYTTTYVYGNDTNSYTTQDINTAYNQPFGFVIGANPTPPPSSVPAVSMPGLVLLVLIFSVFLGATIVRQKFL